MGITVLDGDFQNSAQVKPVPSGIEYWECAPGRWVPERRTATVENLQFVNENTSGGGGFSPLWGAIGEETIGPAGLLLGVNGKKAKQTIYFKCTLTDGRSFTGSTSAKEYQNFRRLAASQPASDLKKKMDAIGPFLVIAVIFLFLTYLGSGH